MKRILITGGAGFVGRRFCKRFLDAGDQVVCIDPVAPDTGGIDPDGGWPLFDPTDYDNFEFVKDDCRTWFAANLQEHFDYVLHLAAMVGGRAMIENRPLAVADDLSIDAEYWQWAEKARPDKTVCFSSSAAYPIKFQKQGSYRLLAEDMISFDEDIGMPDMSYGWAKLTCEYLARLAHEKHALASVCYRPFSGYGEDQDMTYPFPSIVKRAIDHKDEAVLKVWGTGEQMRDFIHIEDCVDGVLSTMDKVNDARAVNLSTGIFTSFREFAGLAARQVGYSPEIVGMSDQPTGVFARGGDIRRQAELGFVARTQLDEGIRTALRHFEAMRGRPLP